MEVLGLAAVEVEAASAVAVALVAVVLPTLLGVGEHLVSCKGEGERFTYSVIKRSSS